MKSLSRSEFESLISEKSPKIITRNMEIIMLTKDQAMEWYDSTTCSDVNKVGFAAECNYGIYIGYGSIDTTLMVALEWYKIGGQQ